VVVILPLAILIVPPIWGALADLLHARLPVLRLALAGSALGTLLFAAGGGLAGAMAAMAAFAIFRAPVPALLDAITYEALGSGGEGYGRHRVWGSAGFAGLVLVLGHAGGSLRPLLPISVAAGGFALAMLATLPVRSPPLRRERDLARAGSTLLRRPGLALVLAGNGVYYFGHTAYDAFFALHARRLGMGDDRVGDAWALGIAVEIGIMLLGPRIFRRDRGGRLLLGCALAAALRWTLTSVVVAPALLVAVQALHGITFGLWYLSATDYLQRRAPDRLRASAQGVSHSLIGLGTVAGVLTAGRVLERLGGATLYRVAAAAALLAGGLYALGAAAEGRARRAGRSLAG
jgi:PPP family 3-phenylpropionic acid transporter